MIDLVTEGTSGVLEIVLLHSSQSSKNDELEDEVGEGAQNDKVVEAGLDLAHLGRPPVRDPVD